MKLILIITAILALMSCTRVKTLNMETVEYPITIEDIILKSGGNSRGILFKANNGTLFTESESTDVDYIIKHYRIGDTIKTSMTATTVKESDETQKIKKEIVEEPASEEPNELDEYYEE